VVGVGELGVGETGALALRVGVLALVVVPPDVSASGSATSPHPVKAAANTTAAAIRLTTPPTVTPITESPPKHQSSSNVSVAGPTDRVPELSGVVRMPP
jgi:hypothetical protein